MFKTLIKDALNIDLTEKQLSMFNDYYNKLIDYNKHTNLTRITDEKEVYIKHFLDSCLLGRLTDFSKIERLCDMGAGAGFPSVPLLIVYPNLKVTIVESQIKRINFLNELKKSLELSFDVIHERAEVYASKNQEKFDVVTARALGELNMILEFGIPMLKVNGHFIAPKGSKYQEEIDAAKNALKTLEAKILKTDTFELVEEAGFRANILIQKTNHVKGYPRAFSLIAKKPL